MSKEDEEEVPYMVRHNWVYILLWECKEVIKNQPNNKQMKNAVRSIELKSLQVMENLLSHRLNMQVFNFLRLYRQFQEQWLSKAASLETGMSQENGQSELVENFEKIFQGGGLEVDFDSP